MVIKKRKYQFQIDEEDLPKIQGYNLNIFLAGRPSGVKRWRVQAVRYLGKKVVESISLSRLIMRLNKEDKRVIDHINHDGLDNRKGNLRICSRQQNNQNSRKGSNNTSGYKGVCKIKDSYRAEIGFNNKHIYIGKFRLPEEAALAYNKKAIELHGGFAVLNQV